LVRQDDLASAMMSVLHFENNEGYPFELEKIELLSHGPIAHGLGMTMAMLGLSVEQTKHSNHLTQSFNRISPKMSI